MRKVVLGIFLVTLLFLSACGASNDQEPPTETTCEHIWSQVTCDAGAVCPKCGEVSGNALGHDFQNRTCTQAATCTRCGKTKGNPYKHDFERISCLEPEKCTRCGELKEDAAGHVFEGGNCIEPSVCKHCEEQGELGDHFFHEATCETPAHCKYCGAEGNLGSHIWSSSTCIAPQTCKTCGHTIGNPLGHTTQIGECTRCGESVTLKCSGYGDDVISGIDLENGIFVAHITNSGGGYFSVYLYDASDDKDLLVSNVGTYDGLVLLQSDKFPLSFNIQSDGDWVVEIYKLGTTSDKSFTGSGDFVTPIFSGETGAYTFTHDGDGYFSVKIWTMDGRDLVVSEVGSYTGTQIVVIPNGSKAFFEINADGDWSITPE